MVYKNIPIKGNLLKWNRLEGILQPTEKFSVAKSYNIKLLLVYILQLKKKNCGKMYRSKAAGLPTSYRLLFFFHNPAGRKAEEVFGVTHAPVQCHGKETKNHDDDGTNDDCEWKTQYTAEQRNHANIVFFFGSLSLHSPHISFWEIQTRWFRVA